jgi:hypothetical protein
MHTPEVSILNLAQQPVKAVAVLLLLVETRIKVAVTYMLLLGSWSVL